MLSHNIIRWPISKRLNLLSSSHTPINYNNKNDTPFWCNGVNVMATSHIQCHMFVVLASQPHAILLLISSQLSSHVTHIIDLFFIQKKNIVLIYYMRYLFLIRLSAGGLALIAVVKNFRYSLSNQHYDHNSSPHKHFDHDSSSHKKYCDNCSSPHKNSTIMIALRSGCVAEIQSRRR